MSPARVVRVLAVPAVGGYYIEDLAALQARPTLVAERYTAPPATPGFRAQREVAEAVSIGLVLDSGQVAWGDCVAVAYSGKAGRDPVFRSADGLDAIRRVVAPALEGRELGSFRQVAADIDGLLEPPVPAARGVSRREFLRSPFRLLAEQAAPPARPAVPRPLHTAVRYGVSQALLQAAAMARGQTMAEVVADEWGLPPPDAPVAIHAQSGADRHHNADKMIVRRVASLPHALVDDVPEQLGADGDRLVQYARWLKDRIRQLGGDEYSPAIHLDVHGALGQIFGNNLGRVLGQIRALELAVQPYPLRIECPVMMDSRGAQIEGMKTLRGYIRARGYHAQLVADEWANTLDDIHAFIEAGAADMIQIKMPDLGSVGNSVEAVLACRRGGVGAFLGGSCAETDLSARVAVHVALATRPDMVMARPGMGVDEAVSLAQNEMSRTLAEIAAHGVVPCPGPDNGL
jgi:methylaspartate ammonia-lyase